jgi:alanine racemase
VTETKSYGGWLELDRAALVHNLAGVRRLAGDAHVMPVVKANAYGAGAAGMARILQNEGVRHFAVATVEEALELRDAGIVGEILCLTYFDASDTEAIRRHRLTPSVQAEHGASLLGAAAARSGHPQRIWVKIDTGLGRAGVPFDEAAMFIEALRRDARLHVTGVYSTLTENRTRDRQQLTRLLALREQLRPGFAAEWSLASSNGILTLPGSCLDVVRPGVMLLGFLPSEPDRLDADRVALADLMPVVAWKARIAGIRTLPAGEQVGYGERSPLERDTRVASLMVGWADGYPGSTEHRSHALAGGNRCPVLASSANTTLIDVSAVQSLEPDDEAVLLGRQNGAEIGTEEFARAGGGVYRMLARIPARAPRIWS